MWWVWLRYTTNLCLLVCNFLKSSLVVDLIAFWQWHPTWIPPWLEIIWCNEITGCWCKLPPICFAHHVANFDISRSLFHTTKKKNSFKSKGRMYFCCLLCLRGCTSFSSNYSEFLRFLNASSFKKMYYNIESSIHRWS